MENLEQGRKGRADTTTPPLCAHERMCHVIGAAVSLQPPFEGSNDAPGNWTPRHGYHSCSQAEALRHKASLEQRFCYKHVFRGGDLDIRVRAGKERHTMA
jgi:hypothetical protein